MCAGIKICHYTDQYKFHVPDVIFDVVMDPQGPWIANELHLNKWLGLFYIFRSYVCINMCWNIYDYAD